MNWIQLPLGPLQTNCYLLINDRNECIVFDPGEQGDDLIEYIVRNGWKPQAILLTHAHFDHIGAVDHVRDYWDIPVYIHELEAEWLTHPNLNSSNLIHAKVTARPANYMINGESALSIGNFHFQLLYTPGHSPGSISYYVEEENILIAGDTLFAESIGRTDLIGGNHGELLASIEKNILTLPNNTIILPGHGPATTVENEKEHNPFI